MYNIYLNIGVILITLNNKIKLLIATFILAIIFNKKVTKIEASFF